MLQLKIKLEFLYLPTRSKFIFLQIQNFWIPIRLENSNFTKSKYVIVMNISYLILKIFRTKFLKTV